MSDTSLREPKAKRRQSSLRRSSANSKQCAETCIYCYKRCFYAPQHNSTHRCKLHRYGPIMIDGSDSEIAELNSAQLYDYEQILAERAAMNKPIPIGEIRW